MATKKEIWSGVQQVLGKYEVEESMVKELTELLEPGKGGQQINLSEITRLDGDIITHIKCRYSGCWFPATTEYFPKDSNSKAVNEAGDPLYTVSKLALKIRQETTKTYAASKEAITSDLLDEVISPVEAREALAGLTKEPDYSTLQDVE